MSISSETPINVELSDSLKQRLEELASRDGRVILGITGAPGAGKSTLVTASVGYLRGLGLPVVGVPMDGYHLADVELDRLGIRNRKGAIETFDGDGYLDLIRRIREGSSRPIYAPAFDRSIEQPIAGAIAVLPDAKVVVTEGNYLLDPSEPWAQVRDYLDESWYCDLDPIERVKRLVARHVHFGKSPDAAEAWVARVDENNAARIAKSRERAHRIVESDEVREIPLEIR